MIKGHKYSKNLRKYCALYGWNYPIRPGLGASALSGRVAQNLQSSVVYRLKKEAEQKEN